jgi:RNA polymerase sigma-70 factor (ECF subfamily)
MTDPQREYDQLVAPIEDRMIRSIWRIVRNQADAEDAMQEALVGLWKRWDAMCKHPNPHALILKFCIDAALDKVRQRLRQNRNRDPEAIVMDVEDRAPSPLQQVANLEHYERLLAAVNELPKQQATAMLMRVIQSQSYRDIASAMRCTEATARKHVARGRARLHAVLRRDQALEGTNQ